MVGTTTWYVPSLLLSPHYSKLRRLTPIIVEEEDDRRGEEDAAIQKPRGEPP